MRLSYLELGRIVGTHGVKGEMKAESWCDSPDFFKNFSTVYFGKSGEDPHTLKSSRPHKNMVLITIDGIDNMDKAEALRGQVLYVKREDAPLDDSTVFVAELIGCTVADADDPSKVYGKVTDVSNSGAQDIWYIKNGSREYLMPNIPGIVEKTDVENDLILVRPIPGIFDDAEELRDED